MILPLHNMTYTLIVGLLAVCLNGCDDYDAGMMRLHAESAEKLMPVVEALEKYHADHGEYPEDINDVIPDYLESLPQIPDREGGLWYKRRDWYPAADNFDQSSREYYLTVGIPSTASMQIGEELSYYPARWRTSPQLDYEPTPDGSTYGRPIAIDDHWVRYRR